MVELGRDAPRNLEAHEIGVEAVAEAAIREGEVTVSLLERCHPLILLSPFPWRLSLLKSSPSLLICDSGVLAQRPSAGPA